MNSGSPGTVSLLLPYTGRSDRLQDEVDRIELVYNGEITSIDLPYNFQPEASGWFLIRIITKMENTFRFASTAPWYVEFMDKSFQPEIEDVKFFLNWTNQRIESVRNSDLPKPQMEHALKPHFKSREFWSRLID